MMRAPVQPDAPRRHRRLRAIALFFVAFGAVASLSAAARAAPLALAGDSDFAAFADRLRAFADASRVRWVVAAKTRADAESAVATLANRLAPLDRSLLGRIDARAFSDVAPKLADSVSPLAWMVASGDAQGAKPLACSWQVAVSDPAFPTVGEGPLAVSLAPNDRLPVGAAATFRVGHSGLLQSKLYAFDETRPGAIRDLATVADADIPVAVDPAGDTIILAMARQTAPFLERVKSALSASDGARRDLGKEFALRDKLLGQGRGIGANIQLIPPSMLSAKKEVAATAEPKPRPDSLMETCLYALTPGQ
jgi:hypothetical protein